MLEKQRILDAAQYIIEPPDLFTQRVPARLKDSAPRVVPLPDGGEGWSYEDGAWLRPLGLEVAGGHSPIDIKDHGYSYSDIRRAMYDPRARLDDMRADEIDAALIYPTYALDVRSISEPELHIACIRAYNDGVWDWCREGDGSRLFPQAMIPASGRAAALEELHRVIKKGFRGIVFSGFLSGGAGPAKEDDAFFKVCEEAGIVVDLLRGGPNGPARTPAALRKHIGARGAHVREANPSLELMLAQEVSIKNENIAWLVLSGITERMPGLRVSVVDAGAGWIRTTGELLDWNYRYAQFYGMPVRLPYVPSDYVKRNFKATLKDERFVVIARHDFGEQFLMWSSNYPNSTTTWPHSRPALTQALEGVPEDERLQIQGATAAAWYGVKVNGNGVTR